MLLLAFILCYLLGLSILLVISRKYSLAEAIGFSFLLGIAFETVFMFLLDLANIRFSQGVLIGLNVFTIVAISSLNYKNLLKLKDEFRFPEFNLKDVNLPALLIFGFGAYMFYVITVKNLFWPTTEHDAINGYDELGKLFAIEGHFKVSLYKYNLEAGGAYPPLFFASLGYVYLFGALMGKILTTFFFGSLLVSFYGLARRYIDATGAMLFTVLLMLTPEMFSHGALELGNIPTAAYVGPGAVATFVWLDTRERKYFWLGALLIAFANWNRGEAIAFTIAAFLIIGIDFLKTKDWKSAATYMGIVIAPFIVWSLYVKLKLGLSEAGRFDTSIGYNAARMDQMTGYLKAYLFGGQKGNVDGGQLYGLTFVLFFLSLLVNIALMYWVGVKRILRDKMYALLFFFTALFFYFMVFYLINEKIQNAPIWSLMESSFKRGMFCFVPLAYFYTATNFASVWAFSKLEKFRNP